MHVTVQFFDHVLHSRVEAATEVDEHRWSQLEPEKMNATRDEQLLAVPGLFVRVARASRHESLTNHSHAEDLEGLHALPQDDVGPIKEESFDTRDRPLLSTELTPKRIKREAAVALVLFVNDHQRLIVIDSALDLSSTIPRIEVSPGEEEEDTLRPIDVPLQVADILEVVHVCVQARSHVSRSHREKRSQAGSAGLLDSPRKTRTPGTRCCSMRLMTAT
jgi:hypothetical protein